MRLAIASGKGGTGKTTVAVSLALSLTDAAPLFLDCDVEEPNAALFLRPTLTEQRDAVQRIPVVDTDRCTGCGRCAEVCEFHAIVAVGQDVLVFPELCHGCGSCARACQIALSEAAGGGADVEGAIREVDHKIGLLERGHASSLTFAQGTLNVGEPMAVPVIGQLKRWALETLNGDTRPVIFDAPPGTSCPVVETMRGADAVLLVTEPTPFGLHDLRIAVEVARDELSLPVAVVINRDGVGDAGVDDFCAAEHIPILLRIPLARGIAEGIANGQSLVDLYPAYREHFRRLWQQLTELATTGVNLKP